jgi:hypothetical protein
MCGIQVSVVSYGYGDDRRTIQTAEIKISDLFFLTWKKNV